METNYPPPGVPIKGIVQSADASSVVTATLYDEVDGTTYTLQSDEYLVITGLTISPRSAGRLTVFLDANDNGTAQESEILYAGNLDAQANNIPLPGFADFKAGLRGRDGADLKVLADTAIGVDLIAQGFVRKNLSKSGPVGT